MLSVQGCMLGKGRKGEVMNVMKMSMNGEFGNSWNSCLNNESDLCALCGLETR